MVKEIKLKGDKEIQQVPSIKDKALRINMNENIRCPICGAGMVLRTASRGTFKGKNFYGCSRYNEGCRGIINVEEENTQTNSNFSESYDIKNTVKKPTEKTLKYHMVNLCRCLFSTNVILFGILWVFIWRYFYWGTQKV